MTDNPPVRKYINKTENKITFEIKTGYYLQFLTSETVKLIKNSPHLEITEVLLVPCNIVNNDFQEDSRVLHTFFPMNRLVNK